MKKAVCDLTIRVIIEMGDDYDEHDCNFRLNESSMCLSGIMEEIGEKSAEDSEKGLCNICYRMNSEFVRWLEPGEDETNAVAMR